MPVQILDGCDFSRPIGDDAAFNSDKIESFSFGSDQLFIEIANVKAK